MAFYFFSPPNLIYRIGSIFICQNIFLSWFTLYFPDCHWWLEETRQFKITSLLKVSENKTIHFPCLLVKKPDSHQLSMITFDFFSKFEYSELPLSSWKQLMILEVSYY